MEGEKSKRPKNSAFRQQRLKAWQPILTPKSVIPAFLIIGLIFVPLGIGLYITSENVKEITMDYTECALAPATLSDTGVPEHVSKWSYDPVTKNCVLEFEIQEDFSGPVFLYYRLTNFYQNHRRYVRSFNSRQLRGEALAYQDLTECDPLDKVTVDGTVYGIYPCGLIANSIFNDTFSNLTSSDGGFSFSEKGIAWPSDKEKFKNSNYQPGPTGNFTVVPPPYWTKYNGYYTVDNLPKIEEDEHFQVWMRTAGLPNFRKLYGRSDDTLKAGTYQITVNSIYNVKSFEGTKSIVISTVSWMGGKNPFLGIAYMTVGSICLALGIAFLVKHLVSPRKLGDHQYLKWN